ncbi:MAG TPA: hypothetical protein PKJ63_02120 [Cyclobacteriaceae bacterium]|nr:hypothetical protein [Cyclobacteriaceae bacterium]
MKTWEEQNKIPVGKRITKLLREKTERLNIYFNSLSIQKQRATLLTIGLFMAAICLLALAEGINPKRVESMEIDAITSPHTQKMKERDSTELIPLGKMKGEINGEFTAFYVAMDRKGNFFKNDNPTYSKERWVISKDWEQLTYAEFMEYEKQLHFQPIESKNRALKR